MNENLYQLKDDLERSQSARRVIHSENAWLRERIRKYEARLDQMKAQHLVCMSQDDCDCHNVFAEVLKEMGW